MNKQLSKWKYPPTIDENGDLTYDKPEIAIRPLPAPPGYAFDLNNPLHLINEWQPCRFRGWKMWERECGAAAIRQTCGCPSCPKNSKILRPDDCDFCDFADGA